MSRIPFAIVGCIMYYILYFIFPKKSIALIGMLGGIMVGFSATYKWQTVFNALGALSSAVPILGLEIAIIFRIVNNIFGAMYGRLFSKIFDKPSSISFISVLYFLEYRSFTSLVWFILVYLMVLVQL